VSNRIGVKTYVVHRIDRETSGVVLFAKNAETHRELSKAFELREVTKTYLALVEGQVTEAGVVRAPLKERGSGRVSVHPKGKSSETLYQPMQTDGKTTLLEVHPLTGRRHQIRVHLYSIGHPVMGDSLYGKDRPVGGVSRLMLHAARLVVPRGSGQPLDLKAEMPEDFMKVLDSIHFRPV